MAPDEKQVGDKSPAKLSRTRRGSASDGGELRQQGSPSDTRDLTGEVRRLKRVVRKSDARLQAWLTSAGDVVFEYDRNGTYLDVWTNQKSLLIAPRRTRWTDGLRRLRQRDWATFGESHSSDAQDREAAHRRLLLDGASWHPLVPGEDVADSVARSYRNNSVCDRP